MTCAETGLPGSPKTSVSPRRPNTSGAPGLIAHLREEERRAELDERGLDEVVVPRRDAAGHEQHVDAGEAVAERGSRRVPAIGRHTQQPHARAR